MEVLVWLHESDEMVTVKDKGCNKEKSKERGQV